MTRSELAKNITNRTNLFKGHTDGRWYGYGDRGEAFYMTAEFSNVAQATMFAQNVIWDFQVEAYVSGGDWDDSTQAAQVNIKRVLA